MKPCPCCGNTSFLSKNLPRIQVIDDLAKLMCDEGISACQFADYRLFRCSGCQLEFADPMVEPGNDFYEWLTSCRNYYPARRWEWEVCKQQLSSLVPSQNGVIDLLDVGCGSGQFLQILKTVPNCRAIGMDVSQSSVQSCISQGLNAFQGELSNAQAHLPGKVDVVTLWHVVEHVADPIGLLLLVKSLLKADGHIFFSVPLSPPSYESSWSDPLNAPPHHLTRWTITAIEALARKLQMRLSLILPDTEIWMKRVFKALLLQSLSPFSGASRGKRLIRLMAYVFGHPWMPFIETYRQLTRLRYKQQVLPDIVLVKLSMAASQDGD